MRNKEEISKLGFGFMRLPKTSARRIDMDKVYDMFGYAINNGVNYFDTAYIYHGGSSEKILGDCIKKFDCRDDVYVATKLPSYLIDTKEKMEQIYNKQLERLQTTYIDYYLLHAIDLNVFNRLVDIGVIDFLNEKKSKGEIRNIGFSFHGLRADVKQIIDRHDWDLVLLQYNIIDTEIEEEIAYAASKGIQVAVMEPLRGGILANDIPKEVEELYGSERSSVDWNLSYIYSNPNVNIVLSGMSTKEHLVENIKIATRDNTMSESELETIRKVQNVYKELMAIGCTGCGYCEDCPVEIDIANMFKALNLSSLTSKMIGQQYHFLAIGSRPVNGKVAYASTCIECGKCEKMCPQDLEIIKHLKAVEKQFETRPKKVLYSLINKINRN